MTDIVNNIFSVQNDNFSALALQVFRHQFNNNTVYRHWVQALGKSPETVNELVNIPFMPVSFFKLYDVYTGGNSKPEIEFESSGTTTSVNSRHKVKDLQLYITSCVKGFEGLYGSLENWCVLGLLPSYLERTGSSLVLMVDEFIRRSGNPLGGFYLHDHTALANTLKQLEQANQPTLLIGVTFGLLDFAADCELQLKHTVIMETGGMKGRRKEMVRAEVHTILKERLGVQAIHSEYGMTEMLSQAYSKGEGIFHTVPWLKVLVRDEEDPLAVETSGSGILNIIDLANVYSCAFLATDDAGVIHNDGSFEVNGRVDHSDLRGCSLMVAEV